MSNNYELTYILPLEYTEKEIPKIIATINETLKKGGVSITKEENFGKKKIAYPIKQNRHGHFIVTQIQIAHQENLIKINQELNIMPEVIRHSIVKFKAGSFEPTKEIRPKETISAPEDLKEIKPAIEKKVIQKEISLPKEKQTQSSKIALEDLDKKIDEILADDALSS